MPAALNVGGNPGIQATVGTFDNIDLPAVIGSLGIQEAHTGYDGGLSYKAKAIITMDCDKILQEFNAIATQNGWHDKHSAKNLAAAISVEAAELLAELQWLSDAESEALAEQQGKIEIIGAEAADITMYLLALCDKLNIDLAAAIDQKQQLNRKRFGCNE